MNMASYRFGTGIRGSCTNILGLPLVQLKRRLSFTSVLGLLVPQIALSSSQHTCANGFCPNIRKVQAMSTAADRTYGTVFKRDQDGANAAFIMIHGLGDTGAGWASLAGEIDINYVHWRFPSAPVLPVTLNDGMRMPAWYDLPKNMMDVVAKTFDKEGIDLSVTYIRELVDELIQGGIPAERIVIGGFSQGGHIAYKAALLHEPRVAACIALSTYIDPLGVEGVKESNLSMPVFVGHGTDDMVVPQLMGDMSINLLREKGATGLEIHKYPGMGHSACGQEMADLKAFVLKHVPPPNT